MKTPEHVRVILHGGVGRFECFLQRRGKIVEAVREVRETHVRGFRIPQRAAVTEILEQSLQLVLAVVQAARALRDDRQQTHGFRPRAV
jgi:hypothetical protein